MSCLFIFIFFFSFVVCIFKVVPMPIAFHVTHAGTLTRRFIYMCVCVLYVLAQ